MAITITSIQRLNPAPCTHFLVTVNDNGVTRQAIREVDTIREMMTAFPGGAKEALVLAYMLYQIDVNAATVNSLVNDVVVS